jgi:hypothetical protein
MGVWSTDTTSADAGMEPWISELFPEPATPVTTQNTPSQMSMSIPSMLWRVAPRIGRLPVGVRTFSFSNARSWRSL